MKILLPLFVFLSFIAIDTAAQSPMRKSAVTNYTYEHYNGGNQNFDIVASPNGVFAANSGGLLWMNGGRWLTDLHASDEQIVSLALHNDSLYAISETGLYGVGVHGIYFQSELLSRKQKLTILPDEKFQRLIATNQGLLILTTERLLHFMDGRFETLSPPSLPIRSLVNENGSALILTGDGSLFRHHDQSFFRIFNSPLLMDQTLFASNMEGDGKRVLVLSSGVYFLQNGELTPVNAALQQALRDKRITGADINHTYCVVATDQGIYILQRETNRYQHIALSNGLQDEQINAVSLNNDQVWLALDNGISAVCIESPVVPIAARREIGRVQAITRLNSMVYIQTGSGLYSYDPQNDSIVQQKETIPLTPSSFPRRMDEDAVHRWMITDEDSLVLIKRNTQEGTPEVFHSIGRQKGLFYANKCVVSYNGKEMFVYDRVQNKMIPYDLLNRDLGEFVKADYVCNAYDNYYWFCENNQLALVRITENKAEIAFRINLGSWGYHVVNRGKQLFSVSDSIHLVATMQGVVRINSKQLIRQNQHHFPSLNVQSVMVDDTLTFIPNGKEVLLPSHIHTVSIDYSFTQNNTKPILSFRIGNSGSWSPWSENSTLVLHNLPEGNHTIVARLYNPTGIFPTSELTLRIPPPWYGSPTAIFLYLIVGLTLVYFANRAINKRKERKMEERIEREIKEKQTHEILSQNEQFKSDLLEKNSNLALQASLLAKHEMQIEAIRQEVKEHKEQLGERYPNKLYSRLQKMLERDEQSGGEWIAFETHFNQVHQQFITRLRTDYPGLTANDLRICCFLRMDLTTKEIASLMNISVRAVELRRHRLRKRLNLDTEQNLNLFLLDY